MSTRVLGLGGRFTGKENPGRTEPSIETSLVDEQRQSLRILVLVRRSSAGWRLGFNGVGFSRAAKSCGNQRLCSGKSSTGVVRHHHLGPNDWVNVTRDNGGRAAAQGDIHAFGVCARGKRAPCSRQVVS